MTKTGNKEDGDESRKKETRREEGTKEGRN